MQLASDEKIWVFDPHPTPTGTSSDDLRLPWDGLLERVGHLAPPGGVPSLLLPFHCSSQTAGSLACVFPYFHAFLCFSRCPPRCFSSFYSACFFLFISFSPLLFSPLFTYALPFLLSYSLLFSFIFPLHSHFY